MSNIDKTALVAGIEELEGLAAPGFWSFVGGVAAGVAVVAAGTAIGIAIT